MTRKHVSIVTVLLLLPVVAFTVYTNLPARGVGSQTVAPTTDAGFRVHVDPTTGEFVEAPVETEASLPTNSLNFSSEELTIEQSPVSGEMVNLQGRFRQNYAATVNADGKLDIICDDVESVPGRATNDEEE